MPGAPVINHRPIILASKRPGILVQVVQLGFCTGDPRGLARVRTSTCSTTCSTTHLSCAGAKYRYLCLSLSVCRAAPCKYLHEVRVHEQISGGPVRPCALAERLLSSSPLPSLLLFRPFALFFLLLFFSSWPADVRASLLCFFLRHDLCLSFH